MAEPQNAEVIATTNINHPGQSNHIRNNNMSTSQLNRAKRNIAIINKVNNNKKRGDSCNGDIIATTIIDHRIILNPKDIIWNNNSLDTEYLESEGNNNF